MANALPLALAAGLAGCASSMSGIGGTESYACKAPEGALCTSVSGVYANSVHGTPRALSVPAAKAAPAASYGAHSLIPSAPAVFTPAGTAIRSSPRVLRVWIAPWEDSDGDLHEEAIVHVVVDSGRWLIEHVRPTSGRGIDGVSAPAALPTDIQSKPAAETPPSPERLPFSPGGTLPRTGTTPQER